MVKSFADRSDVIWAYLLVFPLLLTGMGFAIWQIHLSFTMTRRMLREPKPRRPHRRS